MREDEVASFDRLVTGEARFEERLTGRFAILELSEPQPLVVAYFFFVLDHELNIRGKPATKDWARPKILLFSSDGT